MLAKEMALAVHQPHIEADKHYRVRTEMNGEVGCLKPAIAGVMNTPWVQREPLAVGPVNQPQPVLLCRFQLVIARQFVRAPLLTSKTRTALVKVEPPRITGIQNIRERDQSHGVVNRNDVMTAAGFCYLRRQ